MRDLQAPAYPGGDPRFRRPIPESPLGPAWDTAITYTAVILGIIGGIAGLGAILEGSGPGLLIIGLGYLFGGLLNAYLSALWEMEQAGFWARLLVVAVKPPLMLFLLVAILTVILLWVLVTFTNLRGL